MHHELSAIIQEGIKLLEAVAWPGALIWGVKHYDEPIKAYLKEVTKITLKDVSFERPGQQIATPVQIIEAANLPAEALITERKEDPKVESLETVPVADSLQKIVKTEQEKKLGPTEEIVASVLDEILENEADIVAVLKDKLIRTTCRYLLYHAYANIYGSQIIFMEQLNLQPAGISELQVKEFYVKHADESRLSYEDWFEFLDKSGFLLVVSKKIKLSNMGSEFLAFLVTEKLSKDKLY